MQDFNEYQIKLFKDFERFRPKYSGPSYPPYHKGLYLEEYFFNKFLSLGKITEKYLIPVFWTNCYLQNNTDGLQNLLDGLDKDKDYFCVSQHDDAIKEYLPANTIHFNAGGNRKGIPIPLVCSPIKQSEFIPSNFSKKTFCSFVGSNTHPIRRKMFAELSNKVGFELYCKEWSGHIGKFQEDFFIKKTCESLFSLCPRGYGASSFRFYEAMQLESVPVFIYDKPWFPFENIIDWDSFSIRVNENDIDKIPDILIKKTPFVNEMAQKAKKIYKDYFSLEATANQIFRILNA